MFIPISKIISDYPSIPIRGVIHIGAHEAQEYNSYSENNISKIIWIEANPNHCSDLEQKFLNNPDIKIYNEAIYDDEKILTFNISNNYQSSSLLNLKEHKNKFCDVYYTSNFLVKTKRMDTLIKEKKIKIEDFNFLNVDVQGADLNAILSMGEYIQNMDFIYSEINTIEMYEGCHLINQFDDIMGKNGFNRVDLHIYEGGGWGDALYIRRNLL